jgi:hypothetical protein
MKSLYKIFIGKSGRRSPLGRLGHRWEDDIKRNLKEVG